MIKAERSKGSLLKSKRQRGFTLIEVLVASTLLGFSLIVMFGMHAQALRSNMHAKKMTDCTYLAQTRMEHLLTLGWPNAGAPPDLTDSTTDPTTTTTPWLPYMELPLAGATPPARNGGNSPNLTYGPLSYFVSWDILPMDTNETWARIRVRCQYFDNAFSRWHGTTVSSFRFRDN
jgi:prepilin-type N-terminal cleavage/methylation domain-containing protein